MKFEESVKFTKFDATSVAFAIIPSKRYDFPRIFNVTSKTSSQFPAGKLFHNERIQGTEEFFLLSELKKGEKLKLKEKLEKFLKVYKNRRSICSTLRLIFLSSSSPLSRKDLKKKRRNSKRAYFNYSARKSQTTLDYSSSWPRQERYDSYYLAPSIHQLSFPNSRPFKLFQEGVY